MQELNEQQEAAADFIKGICAVVAGVGSGKTRTLTHRIVKLIKVHGVAPEQILAISFTRNVAEEMRNRLLPLIGDMASRVTLTNIHSFCHYLLKREGKVFEILSGRDQVIFVRGLMKQLRIKDLSVGMVLREISLSKNNLISVEEFRDLCQGDKTMM